MTAPRRVTLASAAVAAAMMLSAFAAAATGPTRQARVIHPEPVDLGRRRVAQWKTERRGRK